ncbi:nucleotidyltransferase domain-containing protein [Candidatus Woesearchaeota archaeon]|nr:nucleotidyltransferase domain-containing protein [Candidatus Woesearchaeota archaeon]
MTQIIKLTNLEAKILRVFTKKFDWNMSILDLSKEIDEHYPNTYDAVKDLEKKSLLKLKSIGSSSICSLNLDSNELPIYLSFVEEQTSKEKIAKFHFIDRLIKEAKRISPVICIGMFGSQVTGITNKKSDIDLFIFTESSKLKDFKDFKDKYFPELENKIDLTILSFDEFIESLNKKTQFTVSLEINKNKIIFYGAEIYYQIIQEVLK